MLCKFFKSTLNPIFKSESQTQGISLNDKLIQGVKRVSEG
jgi:hypothetical protein